MNKFNLVIFDGDGVLVDSEIIANVILLDMLNEIGLYLTLEDVFDICAGKSTAICLETIQDILGQPLPSKFATEFEQRTMQAFIKHLKPVQGIHDVLSKLNLSFCVASNSSHQWLRQALLKTDLFSYFAGKIFTATGIIRSKPYPDVFLYAAETMGFSPEECLVIEDTPTGVMAGVNAGMTVFGYSELTKPKKLREAGASVVFNDMRLLPKLLEQENNYLLSSAIAI
ncbi:HAD family hydrolase [Calothrix sp. FACHB-1219]|uniref:HAD family hydrolase n=1 Tax=unclassified Calothrix TaxID=2619626 RepID=UPI001684335C|nr:MULTISPECIES: HAD family hydrolase [unclassified Calothrix]MBD2207180.1 HAD family hydrolase [Calothrix sp. FACHB-168]MBD2221837.1 HAD family hydrolase [Calothrix sp. FACHB-1219]